MIVHIIINNNSIDWYVYVEIGSTCLEAANKQQSYMMSVVFLLLNKIHSWNIIIFSDVSFTSGKAQKTPTKVTVFYCDFPAVVFDVGSLHPQLPSASLLTIYGRHHITILAVFVRDVDFLGRTKQQYLTSREWNRVGVYVCVHKENS